MDENHKIVVSGKMYRPAPVARLIALAMMQRTSGASYKIHRKEGLNTEIVVESSDQATSRVQAALKAAMAGIEQPSMFAPQTEVPEFASNPEG